MKGKTTKKKQWGGPRPNSGPKPKDECELKKVVYLYVKQGDLDRMGGVDAFREKCYALVK